jgi:hypothetical protein
MIEKKSPFFAYRYLVTPVSQQTTLIQQISKPKEELMRDIVDGLATNVKTEWTKSQKRYLFYGFQKKDEIYIIKFARESTEDIYIEGDRDIEVRGIKEAKFVYLIVHTTHQIIFIEKNVSAFQQMDACVNALASFFRGKMREFDYVVNIYPLVSKTQFWNYVDSADKIFELSLKLNAPNFPLFGNEDTREILKKIKETTNNEEFDIGFKNRSGGLKIIRNALESWINYMMEVGGRYTLKLSRNGVKETKKSDEDAAKITLERKRDEKYSEEEMKSIKDKMDKTHTLETREDEGEGV